MSPLHRKLDRTRRMKKQTGAALSAKPNDSASSRVKDGPGAPAAAPKEPLVEEHHSSSSDDDFLASQRSGAMNNDKSGAVLADSSSSDDDEAVVATSSRKPKGSRKATGQMQSSRPKSKKARLKKSEPKASDDYEPKEEAGDSEDDFDPDEESDECDEKVGGSNDEYVEEEDEQEDEDEYDEDNYEEEPAPNRKRSRPSSSTRRTLSGRKKASQDLTDSSEEENSEESPIVRRRSGKNKKSSGRRASSRRASKRWKDSEEESNDSEAETPRSSRRRSTLRRSPTRASARKASKKLAAFKDDDNEGEDDVLPKVLRRSKKTKDEEDEYVEGAEGPEESDEASVGQEASDDEEVAEQAAGIVGDGDVGTADDSSSDEENRWESPKLQIKKVRKPSSGVPAFESSNSSEDEDDADSPLKLVCPSEQDVITMEELPKTHVCYVAPDGQNRHCFALETLRRIALTSAHPQYRQDLTGAKPTFLQPPHFRSAMSDDLLDQIASRFGREALDLHGPYYHRIMDIRMDRQEPNVDSFTEQVHSYVRSQMGSEDLYACPLCYTVAHRRYVSPRTSRRDESESDEDKLAELYSADFRYDPMSVLGSLDDDAFEIASVFCFKQVAKLKKHLREDHDIDIRNVQGNDLYARFKVRGQDGLLQRWIQKFKKMQYRRALQGHLMQYWNEGHNFSFVFLLHLVSHAQLCRETIGSRDGRDGGGRDGGGAAGGDDASVEEAAKYLQPAEEYFSSFADLAPKLWDILSSPYIKVTRKDLEDFIDDNESIEEEEDPETSHRALEFQAFRESLTQDQEEAARYERIMRKEQAGSAESGDDSEESRDEFEDESVDDVKVGQYEESSEEEEEDPWMEDKLNRRSSIGSRKSSLGSRASASSRKRRGQLKIEQGEESSEEEVEVEKQQPASGGRHQPILLDSDDDVMDSSSARKRCGRLKVAQEDEDSDEELGPNGRRRSSASQRRLVIDDDSEDEE